MPGVFSQGSADSTLGSHGPGFDIRSSVSRILTAGTCSGHGGRECPSGTTYETWALKPMPPSIFSVEASPARTFPSPDKDAASCTREDDPTSSSSSSGSLSLSLFDPDGFSSRTYRGCSPRTLVGTSESCLERWPTSGTAWATGFSTHVSSECRSDADGCSSLEPSLTEILEPPLSVPGKYSLSARAASGILRRAEKRGRMLPGHLAAALESVAGHRTPSG